LEKNQFVGPLIRPPIPGGSAPLDDGFVLKKTLINQSLKIGFRALTWFPPISGGGGGLKLLLFPLGGTSLVAGHPCGHEMLYSHTLGGYSERGGGARFLGRMKGCATSSHTENELDLTLEVAVVTGQRKTIGSSSKKHK
jgi:hypothetical protein